MTWQASPCGVLPLPAHNCFLHAVSDSNISTVQTLSCVLTLRIERPSSLPLHTAHPHGGWQAPRMAAHLSSTCHQFSPLAWHRSGSQTRQQRAFGPVQAAADHGAYLLDYGAGNVRSVRNACKKLGYDLHEVRESTERHANVRFADFHVGDSRDDISSCMVAVSAALRHCNMYMPVVQAEVMQFCCANVILLCRR